MPWHVKEKAEFAVTSYQVGALLDLHFLYSWGWKLSSGALFDYPEFKQLLGPPEGAYNHPTPVE